VREKIILIFVLLFTLQSLGKDLSSVKVTTMNIAWYGNTKFHSVDLDDRDEVLKDFIGTDLSSSDIIMFQEITRPERFEQLLDVRYKCSAYDFRGLAHQYVLTCFDQTQYELLDYTDELFNPDRKIAISVPKERLRDVLLVSLRNKATGHIINTFNLHFKAGLNEAERRKQQANEVLEQIKSLKFPIDQTLILGGDFNSYIRNIDGERVSEIDNFLNLSVKKGFDFFTEKDKPTTLARTQKIFDFIMVSTLNKIIDYSIHPVCDKPEGPVNTFDNYEFFKTYVSDHCPVSTGIYLN
jgi:endonuclease/exonuclease/phosphatase family metal-dependent hydrolase